MRRFGLVISFILFPVVQVLAGETPRPVVSVIVESITWSAPDFVGTIAARVESDLGFSLAGTLNSRRVDQGDTVAEGDELGRLDPTSLKAGLLEAEADVAMAQQQLRSAQDAQSREKTLVARGVESKSGLEQADRGVAEAEARFRQAQAAARRAVDLLGQAVLIAPRAGVIVRTLADVGETVAAGQPVVRLAGTDEREVVLDLGKADLAAVPIGAELEVRLLVAPDNTARARLDRVDPVADRQVRLRRAHFSLIDPPGIFRLGALVRVRAPDRATGRLTLPDTAILDSAGDAAVWVVKRPAGVVSKRTVALGARAAGFVQITSGLLSGEEVVIRGIHSLEDGQSVGPRVSP